MRRLSRARAVVATGIVLGASSAALGLLVPAASAADLPRPTVSTSTVAANEYFTISGTGCVDATAGAPLPSVSVRSVQIGDGSQAAPDGSWSLTNSFAGAPPGSYPIQATCHLSTGPLAYPPVTVTVTAASGPQRPAPLPTLPNAPTPPPAAPPPAVAPVPPSTAPPAPASAPSAAATSASGPTPTAPAPSAGAPGPAPGCTDCARLTDDEALAPGVTLTLTYSGFQPGEEVTLVMRSTPVELGTFAADATGVVTANITLPDSAEAGSHTLTLSGPVSGDLVVDFRLAAAPRDRGNASASARTDLILPVSLGAVGLVLLGGAVMVHRLSTHEPDGLPDPGNGD